MFGISIPGSGNLFSHIKGGRAGPSSFRVETNGDNRCWS